MIKHKKKFYINKVCELSDKDNRCIGLFTKRNFKGEGTCCGWYGVEYFQNTTLIAFGFQKNESPVNFKEPFIGNIVENIHQHYDQVEIGSDIWTKVIEAYTAEEAIEIFRNQSW